MLNYVDFSHYKMDFKSQMLTMHIAESYTDYFAKSLALNFTFND